MQRKQRKYEHDAWQMCGKIIRSLGEWKGKARAETYAGKFIGNPLSMGCACMYLIGKVENHGKYKGKN